MDQLISEILNKKRLNDYVKKTRGERRIPTIMFGGEQSIHLVYAGTWQQGLLDSQLKFLGIQDKIKVDVNYFMAIGMR